MIFRTGFNAPNAFAFSFSLLFIKILQLKSRLTSNGLTSIISTGQQVTAPLPRGGDGSDKIRENQLASAGDLNCCRALRRYLQITEKAALPMRLPSVF